MLTFSLKIANKTFNLQIKDDEKVKISKIEKNISDRLDKIKDMHKGVNVDIQSLLSIALFDVEKELIEKNFNDIASTKSEIEMTSIKESLIKINKELTDIVN